MKKEKLIAGFENILKYYKSIPESDYDAFEHGGICRAITFEFFYFCQQEILQQIKKNFSDFVIQNQLLKRTNPYIFWWEPLDIKSRLIAVELYIEFLKKES